jgi:hypothetical protein
MLDYKPDRVRAYAEQAPTADLLDRVTVLRDGMEPAALDIFEAELRSRGVAVGEIDDHRTRREGEVVRRADGWPAACSRCGRPAVVGRWGWHRLWGWVPVFPRYHYYCPNHP